MKNVRLFAVAAALGMFASTVAAAETKAPKVTWSTANTDSVVRVELGDKVLVTAPTATVTLNSKTTECSNGVDSNGDHVVDGNVYALSPDLNSDQGWLWTNTYYWTKPSDSLSTLSLAGARILKPGSAEIDEEVYVNQTTGEYYYSVDEVFAALEKAKLVEVYKNEDGDITALRVDMSWNSSKTVYSYTEIVPNTTRKSEEIMIDETVDYLVNGTPLKVDGSAYEYTKYTVGVTSSTNNSYSVHAYTTNSRGVPVAEDGSLNFNFRRGTGIRNYRPIIVVNSTGRKGYYSFVDFDGTSTGYISGATTNFALDNDWVMGQDKYGYAQEVKLQGTTPLASSTYFKFSKNANSYAQASTGGTPGVAATATASDIGKFVDADGKFTGTVSPYVWDGTKAVETSRVYVADTTRSEANAKDMKSGITYVSGITVGGLKDVDSIYNTFTKESTTWLVKDTSDFVLDDTYKVESAAGELLDAIAYVTKDKAGYLVLQFANWEENTIEVYDRSKNQYVTVDSTNYTKYFKNPTGAGKTGIDGDTVIDGAKLSEITSNSGTPYSWTDGSRTYFTGFDGAVEHDYEVVAKDYTTRTQITGADAEYALYGYDKTSAAGADCGVNPYGTFILPTAAVQATIQVSNPAYNALTKLGKSGYLTIVDIADVETEDLTASGVQQYQGATIVEQFKLPTQEDKVKQSDYSLVIDGDVITFSPEENRTATASTDAALVAPGSHIAALEAAAQANRYGFYELVDIPSNNTNYYVLLTDKAGLDLTGEWTYSSAKENGILDAADGSDIEAKAVRLERHGNYYPAFETEEEALEAIAKLTGIETALVNPSPRSTVSTFTKWYNVAKLEKNGASKVTGAALPTNALIGEGIACEYEVTSVADSSKVTVTNNMSTIDTTKAGVYDLTYTASYEGEALDETYTVKVVVAPKYVRTWGSNGKVKTLTSFYVSNPEAKYAHYEYDWDNNKVAITYYNVDGSIATTSVNPIYSK